MLYVPVQVKFVIPINMQSRNKGEERNGEVRIAKIPSYRNDSFPEELN